ncbi:ATP-binding protein [Cysteiniphilum sp. QT6929]|uniref:sensor histidine kinase n=1 Tax=Cysteiniphilum sp. QT6929 TaxID=2975055 RepID=UPI0024B36406|nr:ATP-binding protein [Cysteiniphilum sp. QT6929]WHN64518.1 ATP-binding protein [Cysteiniphilum sp. QT6929]
MTKSSKLNFKANAGIKDIVGRGLIYDDNVAIIELVKNSKDAKSSQSTIRFVNETEQTPESSIMIADDGKGMTIDDIKDKWLNIAYSEKKGKRLDAKTAYAGNKGVGRFSCDRLGSQLTLYTKSLKGNYLKLFIDWTWFEGKDKDDEISSIDLQCEVLSETQFKKEIKPLYEAPFAQGTILKITHLRSQWEKRKLKTLIAELEKFSPSLNDDFDVYLYTNTDYKITDSEKKNDKSDWWKNLNGKINNNILNTLSFKTTYIHSKIDDKGESIVTTLYYQQEKIYWYTLKNPYKHLKNIEVEIHFLDTISKGFFKRRYGLIAGDYGSVFLFHNGFRVSPYGNYKNDWLGLDYWKSQGHGRRLGTRDVIGKITIDDNEEQFAIMTNREGLIKNNAFWELIAYDKENQVSLINGKESYGFVPVIVRQLENFVIKGLNWGKIVDRLYPDNEKVITGNVIDDPERYELEPLSTEKLREACERILTSDWDVQEFDINTNLVQKLSNEKLGDVQSQILKTLEVVEKKDPLDWSSVDKGAIKKTIQEQQEQKELAEQEWEYEAEKRALAEDKKVQAEQKVEEKVKQNLFLRSMVSDDLTNIVSLHHHIGIAASTIDNYISSLVGKIQAGQVISNEKLLGVLGKINQQVKKITTTTNFATKANFNLTGSIINEDLCAYIEEYLLNVCSGLIKVYRQSNKAIKFNFINSGNKVFITKFKPLELSIILDNLINNSRKAEATKIALEVIDISDKKLLMGYSDNGVGIPKANKPSIFDLGYTTTEGSGLGLSQVKELLQKSDNDIYLKNTDDDKAEFIIRFGDE